MIIQGWQQTADSYCIAVIGNGAKLYLSGTVELKNWKQSAVFINGASTYEDRGCTLRLNNNTSAANAFRIWYGGNVLCEPTSLTLVGTHNYTDAFIWAYIAEGQYYATATGVSATGVRWDSSYHSIIWSVSATDIPGSIAGVTDAATFGIKGT
jgi:hypothetical protein